MYAEERKESAALPHRRNDLEAAILNLQLGKHAQKVHAVLDSHQKLLPQVEHQTKEDQIWQLALYRMDLRRYKRSSNSKEIVTSDGRCLVQVEVDIPDKQIQGMVDVTAWQQQAFEARLKVYMWGYSAFLKESPNFDASLWKENLQQALRYSSEGNNNAIGIIEDGPAFVAAVCVRDHWDAMDEDEKHWCATSVCFAVHRSAMQWDTTSRVQKYQMSGDRACAQVIPLLVGKSFDASLQRSVLEALSVAVTHPVNEVRYHAVIGVGKYLWPIDRTLTVRCVQALAYLAVLIKEEYSKEKEKTNSERKRLHVIEAEQAFFIVKNFFDDSIISKDSLNSMDASTWIGAEIFACILGILIGAPNDLLTVEAFRRVPGLLVNWWDSDEDRTNRDRRRKERSHNAEFQYKDLLENFLLRTEKSNAEAIIRAHLI